MDVTDTIDDKRNVFADLGEGVPFSDEELAMFNNNVYSLEPFDTDIDGILNPYNYDPSAHDTNVHGEFSSSSWHDPDVENGGATNDFLNGGIGYGNLLSAYIDNASGPINPANDLLSLDLLQEQPFELILPDEPDHATLPKTEPTNMIQFDWNDLMIASPKFSAENDQNCSMDVDGGGSGSGGVGDVNTNAVELLPGELDELKRNLYGKFDTSKYDELHRYDFCVDDTDVEAEAAAAATSLPKSMDHLRQYHVFVMPVDDGKSTDHEAGLQSLREKFRKNPLIMASLVGQSLDIDKQSKLIIKFKPNLIDTTIDDAANRTIDQNEIITNDANANVIRTKRCRKQAIKLTEPLKTRNEINDILDALKNAAAAAAATTTDTDMESTDSVKSHYVIIPEELPKGKLIAKPKKIVEPKVTNSRCSERIQQRRRKYSGQTMGKNRAAAQRNVSECDSSQRSPQFHL